MARQARFTLAGLCLLPLAAVSVSHRPQVVSPEGDTRSQ